MIFVTVGGQLPFDRLVRAVDEWAVQRDRSDVFAQIGSSEFRSRRIRTQQFLTPDEFRESIAAASGVVAHAGMGTILTALELGKPLLVMPRLSRYGEQRNDHQLATAERLAKGGQILVAQGEEALPELLDRLESQPEPDRIGSTASAALIARIRAYALGTRG